MKNKVEVGREYKVRLDGREARIIIVEEVGVFKHVEVGNQNGSKYKS